MPFAPVYTALGPPTTAAEELPPPDEKAKVTVSPPLMSVFPYSSRRMTVIRDEPFTGLKAAVVVFGLTVKVLSATLTTFGTKVMSAVSLMATPLM